MDSLGTEIGQKMRSAVKAKLIELGTGSASGYIDDELPDYVMIMVANKRSRHQMIDDLSLFLGSQTEVFVSWLHQVLQKLQEVTLPAVAQKPKEVPGKKKAETEEKKKKEKRKDKKVKRKEREVDDRSDGENTPPRLSSGTAAGLPTGSITDVFASQFIQHARKTLETGGASGAPGKKEPAKEPPTLADDDFDIPSMSAIASTSALQKHRKELCELEEIQQRIIQAKKHLKTLGGSDESEDEDLLNLKANEDDLDTMDNGSGKAPKRNPVAARPAPVVFEPAKSIAPAPPPVLPPESVSPKKKSIMERLGTKPSAVAAAAVTVVPQNGAQHVETSAASGAKSTIISLSAHRREERELYVPVFRRKELEDQKVAREKVGPIVRGRSRERNRERSPSFRMGHERSHIRRDRERERERDRDRDHERERERDRDRERSRSHGRTREKESLRERDRERQKERSSERLKNGTDVRTRIGSRVIMIPPKPEYNEDAIEVPVSSVIKVQPRPVLPKNKQPSKNLLLKAMAEAQRSTAANLRKTIDNTPVAVKAFQRNQKQKLLIEIPGSKSERPSVDVRYVDDVDEEEDEMHEEDNLDETVEIHELDIAKSMLVEEEEELKELLEEYAPEPLASADTQELEDDDGDCDVVEPEKNPKFVVTLDGGYKRTDSKDEHISPSHTPPPASKGKTSIRDRIGKKVSSPRNDTAKEHDLQETLKKRRERFSVKVAPTSAAPPAAVPVPPAVPSPRNQPKEYVRPSNRRSRSRSPVERRSRRERVSPKPKRSSRKTGRSPNQLNELLLQRTKELMEGSVSSSPIYMSKSDYDKMEPASRKRKRVSPIQFNLTDEDAHDESEDDYHRDRDRDRRVRSQDRDRRRSRDHSGESRKDQRHDRARESDRREGTDRPRRSASNENSRRDQKTPVRKIKKLESSRKFDDVPALLSAVSVSSDGKPGKGAIKERCKYFPHCRQGESCEFLHPSTPCKAFPNCKFGDKCLYLHPICKFDKSSFHRVDCNFMHSKSASHGGSSGSSAPPLSSSVVPVQNYKTISAKPLPPLCKYYPNCVNGLCAYYHPKVCRFGKSCMNKVECNFYHYDLPAKDPYESTSKDKFKWISPFSA